MSRRVLLLILFGCVLLAACTSADESAGQAPPAQPTTTPTATAAPTPAPASAPATDGLPDVDAALAVASRRAPLGTYVVARRDAGIIRNGSVDREIPVYDEPFSPPRTLLDANVIDGIDLPINLVNLADSDGVLVLRVIAGGPDDDWLLVQAPVRPHSSYVWVRRGDFDFGYTSKRIEIDLAGTGQLQLLDGDEVILTSRIVQGRDTRETPTHLTYVQHGVRGEQLSPAYGDLILAIASFSEVLSTFGGGNLPSNFIHGTNQPGLMGQRVSSGEIRLPNQTISALADAVVPGTPVLLFDSTGLRHRDQILNLPMYPARTTRFLDGGNGARDGTTGIKPQIWARCAAGDELICPNETDADVVVVGSELEHVFAVAKPDAGDVYASVTEQPMIPVFDEPGGDPRALVYENKIDRIDLDYPLYAETVFGQPTVVSVLKMTLDEEWLLVRAPVLPHDTSVWVRARDFELRSSSLRIEVDIGYEFLGRIGMLSVWDGAESLLAAKISSGRANRPTVATSTYIDQIVDGLGPAYGPLLFSTPSYSETLPSFGGGGIPQQSIHAIGGRADEIMGMPASSGSIHVATATFEQMATIEGMLGARVVIYDSRSPSTTEDAVRNRPLVPATTKPIIDVDPRAPIGSFT